MTDEVIDMLPGVTLAPAPAPAPALAPTVKLPAAAQPGPMGMAMQALSMGMTIADLQGLLALQKDYEANEARKAYVADMAAFKLNPPEIFKEKSVAIKLKDGSAGAQYMHATLGSVCEKIVEGLAKHGFSHRWDTKQPDGGQIFVTCTLTHRLGHSESTTLNCSRDDTGSKNNIQSMASTVTYLQRYTLLGASGLATKDMVDDDGRGADDVIKKKGAEGENEPGLSPREKWIEYAKSLKTVTELEQCRLDAYDAFNAVRDVDGWNAIKAAIKEHRTTLLPVRTQA